MRAVVAQLREAVEQPAGGQRHRAARVLDVDQRAAVHVLGQFLRVGIDRIGIVPGQIEDRIGKGAALLAVERAQPVEDARHDPDIALGVRPADRPPSSAIAASAPN